jgi:hypothetical protein
MRGTYSVHVNSKRNVLALAFASIALLGMGCGGLGASGSLSPASFLLPGIGHHESQQPLPVEAVEQPASPQVTSPQVAAISADLIP